MNDLSPPTPHANSGNLAAIAAPIPQQVPRFFDRRPEEIVEIRGMLLIGISGMSIARGGSGVQETIRARHCPIPSPYDANENISRL
jgi:hypothetical protein